MWNSCWQTISRRELPNWKHRWELPCRKWWKLNRLDQSQLRGALVNGSHGKHHKGTDGLVSQTVINFSSQSNFFKKHCLVGLFLHLADETDVSGYAKTIETLLFSMSLLVFQFCPAYVPAIPVLIRTLTCSSIIDKSGLTTSTMAYFGHWHSWKFLASSEQTGLYLLCQTFAITCLTDRHIHPTFPVNISI